MAESIEPNAVMMMTLSSGRRLRSSASSSCPRSPGMMRSVTTRSARASPLRLRSASSAVEYADVSYPASSSTSPRNVRRSPSSSTTTTRSGMRGLGRHRRGNDQTKHRASVGTVLDFDSATMLFEDALHNCQSQTRPFTGNFCCEEWLEHVRQYFIRNAGARVFDIDAHIAIAIRNVHRDSARRLGRAQRLARVHQQIH